jgi:phosphomannomutase
VDRLVLITEKGDPFSEEYTVASAVEFVLRRLGNGAPGVRPKVVVNLSTTRAVDDIARMRGADVIRTPVGEINVAKKMKAVGAVIGGEGSGGVIFPDVHLGRDAIVGIGLILQLLVDVRSTLSELKSTLPQYAIAKGKIGIARTTPERVFAHMRHMHDGLKIDFDDSWVHLRKSNTEPIVRIIAEARTMEHARMLVDRFQKELTAQVTTP